MEIDQDTIAGWCGVGAARVRKWSVEGMPDGNVATVTAWLAVHHPKYVTHMIGAGSAAKTPPDEGANLHGDDVDSTLERCRQMEFWAWNNMCRAQSLFEAA